VNQEPRLPYGCRDRAAAGTYATIVAIGSPIATVPHPRPDAPNHDGLNRMVRTPLPRSRFDLRAALYTILGRSGPALAFHQTAPDYGRKVRRRVFVIVREHSSGG